MPRRRNHKWELRTDHDDLKVWRCEHCKMLKRKKRVGGKEPRRGAWRTEYKTPTGPWRAPDYQTGYSVPKCEEPHTCTTCGGTGVLPPEKRIVIPQGIPRAPRAYSERPPTTRPKAPPNPPPPPRYGR